MVYFLDLDTFVPFGLQGFVSSCKTVDLDSGRRSWIKSVVSEWKAALGESHEAAQRDDFPPTMLGKNRVAPE